MNGAVPANAEIGWDLLGAELNAAVGQADVVDALARVGVRAVALPAHLSVRAPASWHPARSAWGIAGILAALGVVPLRHGEVGRAATTGVQGCPAGGLVVAADIAKSTVDILRAALPGFSARALAGWGVLLGLRSGDGLHELRATVAHPTAAEQDAAGPPARAVAALLTACAAASLDAPDLRWGAGAARSGAVLDQPERRLAELTGAAVDPVALRLAAAAWGGRLIGAGAGKRYEAAWWRDDLAGAEAARLTLDLARCLNPGGLPALPLPLFSRPDARPPDVRPGAQVDRRVSGVLSGLGLQEVMTESIQPAPAPEVAAVRLHRGRGADVALRCALLPGLVAGVARTLGQPSRTGLTPPTGVFEVGTVFLPGGKDLPVQEARRLAVLVHGSHSGEPAPADEVVADAVRALHAVADELRLGRPEVVAAPGAEPPAGWREDAQGRLLVDGTDVGILGLPAPAGAGRRGRQTAGFELDLDALAALVPARVTRPVRLPTGNALVVDRSFVLPSDVAAARLVAALCEGAGESVLDARVLALYSGDALPTGRRSVTVRLLLTAANEPTTRAFNDPRVVAAAARARDVCGAVPREQWRDGARGPDIAEKT